MAIDNQGRPSESDPRRIEIQNQRPRENPTGQGGGKDPRDDTRDKVQKIVKK